MKSKIVLRGTRDGISEVLEDLQDMELDIEIIEMSDEEWDKWLNSDEKKAIDLENDEASKRLEEDLRRERNE